MQSNHSLPSSNATQPASPMNAEHSHIDDNHNDNDNGKDNESPKLDQTATRMPMLKPALS